MLFNLPEIVRSPPTSQTDCYCAAIAALHTARELEADSRFLFQAGRWCSAAAIAVLALEEISKLRMLMEIARSAGAGVNEEKWKDVLNHNPKLEDLFEPLDFPEPERTRLRKKVGKTLNSLKQLAFYSNGLGNGRWRTPSQLIDKDTAGAIVKLAQTYIDRITPLPMPDPPTGCP